MNKKTTRARYNRAPQSRAMRLHLILNNNQTKVYFILSFMILFFILSYAFMMFSSVSYAYSLNDEKEQLSKIVAHNSSLSSSYLTEKDEAVDGNEVGRVTVGKVDYVKVLDSKFAYNDR